MADRRAWGYIGLNYDNVCEEIVKREYLLDFMRNHGYEVMGVSVGHDGNSVLDVLDCGLMNQLLASANDNGMDVVLIADYSFGSQFPSPGIADHVQMFDDCTRLMEQYQVDESTERRTPSSGFVFMRIQYPVKGRQDRASASGGDGATPPFPASKTPLCGF